MSEKFTENKKILQKQNFAKTYKEKIDHGNANWNEIIEFTKSLKSENIEEIKEIFKQSENNNSIMMCDELFYQLKEPWERFKQGEMLEDISKLWQEPTENDKTKLDLRKKSPTKNMRI
ncbi:hypothetical protein [Spiroplasma endosymbiont of Nebria brevicollis]|uniref:hypothetical protein n=1 Tax=Spiroplasma endosymbiont of Nebria brevicollis TaxID=3066284 RepID=UPI00313D0CC0